MAPGKERTGIAAVANMNTAFLDCDGWAALDTASPHASFERGRTTLPHEPIDPLTDVLAS